LSEIVLKFEEMDEFSMQNEDTGAASQRPFANVLKCFENGVDIVFAECSSVRIISRSPSKKSLNTPMTTPMKVASASPTG